MARGKTQSVTVKRNNQATQTATKTVELIVKNDQLVPDVKETDEGVRSV